MNELWKVIGIGILSAAAVIFLKQTRPEYALLTGLCGGAVMTVITLNTLVGYISSLQGLFADSGIPFSVFSVLLKTLGIGYITEFCADALKDAGQTSLASKVVFAGKTAVMIIALPILGEVLNIAASLLN